MNKLTKSISTVLAWVGVFQLVSLLKINIFFGAKTAAFSGFALAGPLSLFYAGAGLGTIALVARRLLNVIFFGASLLGPFAFYVPTMAAGYYFTSRSWLIRLAVPLLCMALFMLHPVGGQAWFYALYWLVPVVLFFVPSRLQFTEALGATFVQHAVGSVLWLYFMPTTAAMWTALMPVVLIERILCATGMVIVMQVVQQSKEIVGGMKKAILEGGTVW